MSAADSPRILAIHAHPDDVELQCFGTLALLRQRGCEVTIATMTPGGSSVYVALQIGYYLGIRKWYMYGADFSFSFSPPRHGSSAFRSATGDGNHFISNYRSGRAWCPPSIENILPSFYNARLAMEMDGGFIRNATRGGNLHVFDRVDFEVALSETNSQESAREPSLQYPDAVK